MKIIINIPHNVWDKWQKQIENIIRETDERLGMLDESISTRYDWEGEC